MKQLADGGVAFYIDISRGIKKLKWQGFLVGFAIVPFILSYTHPQLKLSVILLISGIPLLVAFLTIGFLFMVQKYNPPSCVVYEEYITWKDTQGSLRSKEIKIFFTDVQSFGIKKQKIPLRRNSIVDNVLFFISKQTQEELPFYPYFSWLNEKDQQLLIELLKDKGLTFLPGDYQPN